MSLFRVPDKSNLTFYCRLARDNTQIRYANHPTTMCHFYCSIVYFACGTMVQMKMHISHVCVAFCQDLSGLHSFIEPLSQATGTGDHTREVAKPRGPFPTCLRFLVCFFQSRLLQSPNQSEVTGG